MNYQDLIDGIKRFGSSEHDICMNGVGLSPEDIRETVILAPWWEIDTVLGLGKAALVSASDSGSAKIWTVTNGRGGMTFIKTGIGAPVLMDMLLTLGVTPCKRIIFIGSIGSLDESMGIGDIVIPEYSFCGDGASRYLSDDIFQDPFGAKAYPDQRLNKRLIEVTEQICSAQGVRWHMARVFSVDTIFAQYAHIGTIISTGCNAIEMETAAAFRAAAMMGIPMVALCSVSDNTLANKTLISGRTREEMDYRQRVRRELIPQIILTLLQQGESSVE